MGKTKILKWASMSVKCLSFGFASFIIFWISWLVFAPPRGADYVLAGQFVKTILFFMPLPFYVLGIVFALIARILWESNQESEEKPGVGVAFGIVLLLGHLIFLVIAYPAAQRLWASERRALCLNNVRSLVQMAHMYAAEYEGEFPDSFNALDVAGYTIGNLTSCPSVSGRTDYGLNAVATVDCPSDTPLVGDFDSSNHSDMGGNIGYVDGATRWYRGEYSAGSGPLEDVAIEDWVRQ